MKKTIVILNEYLSHFWLTVLLLIIGCISVVQFSSLAYSVDYFETNKLDYAANIFGIFLFYFFLPLGILSVVIALWTWLKDKTGKNRQGLISLILIFTTLCSFFLLIIRISTISGNININHSLSLPLPDRTNTK